MSIPSITPGCVDTNIKITVTVIIPTTTTTTTTTTLPPNKCICWELQRGRRGSEFEIIDCSGRTYFDSLTGVE